MDPPVACLPRRGGHRRLVVFTAIDGPVLLAKLVAVGLAAVVRLASYRLVLFRVVRREQSVPMLRPTAPGTARLSVVVRLPGGRPDWRDGRGDPAPACRC